MRKHVILLLLVAILALASVIYKIGHKNIYREMPSVREQDSKKEAVLQLNFFFSKHNCIECLEVIDVLNQLPGQFIVTGIVPAGELESEAELRNITGATFPLTNLSKYVKYAPPYSPSIVGVSKKGRICFVLPAVPEGKGYLENFLTHFYYKAYPLLM